MQNAPKHGKNAALSYQKKRISSFENSAAGAHLMQWTDRRKAWLPAFSVDDVLKAISI